MTEYYRPSTRMVLASVSSELGIKLERLTEFEPEKRLQRARYVAVLLCLEQGYTIARIAEVMDRNPTTITNWLVTARGLLRSDTQFEAQVSTVRTALLQSRKRKPVLEQNEAQQKLRQYMPQIMKLRNLHGPERGWSTSGLSRYFGIPKTLLDQVFGVQKAERG